MDSKQAEEFGSFRFPRNKDWLNLDVLYVADQPEKEAFKAKNLKAGKFCKSFLQICHQTKLKFRNRWLAIHGTEPPPFKEGFAFVSPTWLGAKPKHDDLIREGQELIQLIVQRYNPKVIVALGKNASKILGVDRPTKKARARLFSIHLLGQSFKLLPTYGFSDLNRSKFRYETHVRLDLMRAYKEVHTGNADPDVLKSETALHRHYRTLEQVRAFHQWFKASGIKKISIDFETTGLKYFSPDERIIMACFGFGNKMAATVLLDHRLHPEPENLPEIWEIIKEILEDPTVLKVNHNIKFDYQMAAKKGINMSPIIWCTQCAEHLLYEEKEDAYNLDAMTSEYYPQFENYKKMVDPIGKEAGRVEDKIKQLAGLYKREIASWSSQKDTWAEKTARDFDEACYAEELEMYNRDRVRLQHNVSEWQLQVEIWQKSDKKARGKKPVKPKMTRKKPVKPKFEFKKPKKPEELKELEGQLARLRTARKEQTFEDIDLDVLEFYGGLDGDITLRIQESQETIMYQENEWYIENLTNFYLQYQNIPLPQGYARPDPSTIGTPEYRAAIQAILRKVYPSTLQLMAETVRFMPETIGDMEFRGAHIDQDRLKEIDRDMLKLSIEAEETLKKHAQRSDLNVNSDDEMRALLNVYQFEKILKDKNLPTNYTEKTGKLSLAAEYLEQWEETFRELNNPCGEIFRALLNHRKAHRCRETYLGNYVKLSAVDGKIHTSFFIFGTSGARLSSGDPNLQNVPKKSNMLGYNLKDLFIPTCIEGDTHVNRTDTTNH
jgi:DNA polymerase I-like protein with 3'-5' exonuclease and polymerase domains